VHITLDSATDIVISDIRFPEGNRWHDGRLWYSDMHTGEVFSVDPSSTDGPRLEATVDGQSSGLGWLADGRLIISSMESRTVVAVDGPAGSGKSSVSRAAARALGFDYQDTGAAYRALSWFALESGVDTEDPATVTGLIDGFDYDIGIDPSETRVSVRGTDVTEAIREPRVSAVVSRVARVPEVRH
jgi:hypothetical protein